jgi:hypothetical protein
VRAPHPSWPHHAAQSHQVSSRRGSEDLIAPGSRDERAGPYDTPVSDIYSRTSTAVRRTSTDPARGPQNSAAVEGNSLLSAGSGADASCSAPRALSWCRAEWWRPRAPWLIGAPVKFAAVGGAAPSCSGLSGAAREPLRANSLPAARGRHHSVGHHDEKVTAAAKHILVRDRLPRHRPL